MKNKSEKISMLTAYDFSFTQIIDETGIDIILVGNYKAPWGAVFGGQVLAQALHADLSDCDVL